VKMVTFVLPINVNLDLVSPPLLLVMTLISVPTIVYAILLLELAILPPILATFLLVSSTAVLVMELVN
jgi:hypothetical protein